MNEMQTVTCLNRRPPTEPSHLSASSYQSQRKIPSNIQPTQQGVNQTSEMNYQTITQSRLSQKRWGENILPFIRTEAFAILSLHVFENQNYSKIENFSIKVELLPDWSSNSKRFNWLFDTIRSRPLSHQCAQCWEQPLTL